MDTTFNFEIDITGQMDYYLAQSKALEDEYLNSHGYTREKLNALPVEEKGSILKHAQDFASEILTRHDAMVRLGQRDYDPKPDSQPLRHRRERVDHFWYLLKK